MIHIIGGGLAGCEAAWQAASLGVRVVLHEMRPVRATAVHKTDQLADLHERICGAEQRMTLVHEQIAALGSSILTETDVARLRSRLIEILAEPKYVKMAELAGL